MSAVRESIDASPAATSQWRILMLKGRSQYGAVRHNVDHLAAGFRTIGHAVEVVDLGTGDEAADNAALIGALKAGPDLAFAFNAIGHDTQIGDRNTIDVAGVPYVAALLDHPAYQFKRLLRPMGTGAIACLDRSHVAYLRRTRPCAAAADPLFLPAAGVEAPETVTRVPAEDWRRRDIPILFTGTYSGPPQRNWHAAPDAARLVLDAAADLAEDDDTLPADRAFANALAGLGLDADDTMLARSWSLVAMLESYLRAARRHACLDAMAAADLPVHVYGNGYAGMAADWPSFTFGGEGSTAETLELLQRARVSLGTNCNFLAGGHERVFTAMANGAAAVSDRSTYYDELFATDDAIAQYRWTAIEALPDQVAALLDDPAGTAAMASRGQAIVRAGHLWRHRAEAIAAWAAANLAIGTRYGEQDT